MAGMLGGPQAGSPRCCELLRQLVHLECLTYRDMQATLAVRNIPQSAVRGDSYSMRLAFIGKDPDSNPTGWDIPGGETAVEIPDRMIQFFRQEGRDAANG
jgi:hypothetical protein